MSNLFDYSTTPASNNSAAPVGAPENMLPGSVNDTMRQMMANSVGAFECYTAGGSANAQTVTMSPTLAAYSSKVRIAFIPVANNTGACTLNVNGLGAVSIKMLDGTDPPAGALNSSGVSLVQHNGTNFRLLNPAWGAVSGFTSGGRLYLNTDGGSSTSFIVSTNITELNYESIGPTGSSADNIWTPMDSIPAGAVAAIVFISSAVGSGADTQIAVDVFARQTGSATGPHSGQSVLSQTVLTDDFAQSQIASAMVFIPLDSSRRFDMTWSATGDTSRTIQIYLKGFLV